MQIETRAIVVFGSTGSVGRRLVEYFLNEGAQVIAQGRDGSKLDELTRAHPTGDLHTITADLESDEAVEVFRSAVSERFEIVTGSVAALGGWPDAPPLEALAVADWRSVIDSNLTSHFQAAKAITPLLGGSRPMHILLNGVAGLTPHPGSGAVCVAGAGQHMLVAMMRAESANKAVGYAELFVLDDIDTADEGNSLSHAVVSNQVDRMLRGLDRTNYVTLSADGVASPLAV